MTKKTFILPSTKCLICKCENIIHLLKMYYLKRFSYEKVADETFADLNDVDLTEIDMKVWPRKKFLFLKNVFTH